MKIDALDLGIKVALAFVTVAFLANLIACGGMP
jgi:hypothetical protein